MVLWLNVVSPTNSPVETLPSNVMELGDGRWIGHEGGALMHEINAVIKEAQERSHPPSTMCGHKEPAPHLTSDTPSSDFQPPAL